MILAIPCKNLLAGSTGGGEDILGEVEEPPPGQGSTKGRFYAAKSFVIGSIILMFCFKGWSGESKRPLGPSHLMVGPGLFNVDRTHIRGLIQFEYRWAVNVRNLRPLVTFAIATDENFFLGGGIAYDIFFWKKVVLTPSFAPGVYYQSYGKNLGFPINFRSGIELSFVLGNKGRIGAQFNHISNAHMLHKNPGANTLFVFYAIPFPHKTKKTLPKEKQPVET